MFPAFNYARDSHETTLTADGACFQAPGLSLWLGATIPLQREGNGVVAEFAIQEGRELTFSLQQVERIDACGKAISEDQADKLFRRTVVYWRQWLSQCTYRGRWREMVQRSALTLKLLTFEPTGAIVAAPTYSLPEGVGGNATGIIDTRSPRRVQGLASRPRGKPCLRSTAIGHYGELLDSVYLYNKYGSPISYDLWSHLRRLVNWVCDNWTRQDEGIWEVRGSQQHFLYSKLMCWVAVDRGLRLADRRSFPADRDRWLKVRDTIYEEIMEKGWSDTRQAFVQRYGSDALDAANLMMPLVFFVSPTDPRMLRTLEAINRSPEQGGLVANALVHRYNVNETEDGLKGEEGTFNICTFWLVEALTRAGRVDQARLMFEQMLGYANHVGLYAEETGHHGEGLGNFPQAFTHLALISAAFNLDRVLGSRG